MNETHISDIHIADDRIRQEFDKTRIQELADSIEQIGLLHAPVLRDDRITLVAGENRIKAMELLHSQGRDFFYQGQQVREFFIPYTTLGELDDYHAKLAELEENVRRTSLTWQEEAQARAKLHETYVEKDPAHTMKETAEAIVGHPLEGSGGGYSKSLVKDSITLAQNLSNPEIAKAKSKNEALKVLKKQQEATLREALAESSQEKVSEHTLIHSDALEALRTLESESFECICTDPPYGIEAQSFGDQAENRHTYDDSYDTWSTLMEQTSIELYRVATPLAHAYVFCDLTRFFELSTYMTNAGWRVWPRPFIWSKGYNSMLPRPNHGPHRSYECILFANKGDKPVAYTGGLDVIDIPQGRDLRHAAEKPVDLYRNLLERTVMPGDRVLDCFAGSGPLVPAASKLSCIATLIEGAKENCALIWERMHGVG